MASWSGDLTHYGSSSSWRDFTVKSKPFIETPLGVATMSAAIVAAVVTVLIIVKRRRGKK